MSVDQVTQLVDEYCDKYGNRDLPRFGVHDPQPWKGWWGSAASLKAGCYIIYSEDGEAIYLGKASLKAKKGEPPCRPRAQQ